jgi:RNA polymerase sigma-B factor
MTAAVHPETSTCGRSGPGLRSAAAEERTRLTHELFSLARCCDGEDERRALMGRAIEVNLGVAHREAARYRSRGVPLEDLRQVAALALTKAAQRYDIATGHDFLSYAVPTIRGELRRYFRDHGWMVRPPRRIQELQARINAAEAELSCRLGRSPHPVEVAEHLGEPPESVREALASDGCFVPTSLDRPVGSEEASTLGEMLPCGDSGHGAAEARVMLHPVLRTLPDRDQQILGMRFFEGLTQREIACRIGVTQMQVSRLLTRILAQLRTSVGQAPLD